MPFLVGTLVGGVFEGVKCQKTPKIGGSVTLLSHIFELFYIIPIFFLLDRFKSVSSACSENLAAFGTYLVPLWTKTARAKNRDFRFDDPTLTACNLTHGPGTILVNNLAPMVRMDLSIDASDDHPPPPDLLPPSRENGGGSFFWAKIFEIFKIGRNARGSLLLFVICSAETKYGPFLRFSCGIKVLFWDRNRDWTSYIVKWWQLRPKI